MQGLSEQDAQLWAAVARSQRDLDKQAATLTDVLRAADLALFIPAGPSGPSYTAAAERAAAAGGNARAVRRSRSMTQRGALVDTTVPEDQPVVPLQARTVVFISSRSAALLLLASPLTPYVLDPAYPACAWRGCPTVAAAGGRQRAVASAQRRVVRLWTELHKLRMSCRACWTSAWRTSAACAQSAIMSRRLTQNWPSSMHSRAKPTSCCISCGILRVATAGTARSWRGAACMCSAAAARGRHRCRGSRRGSERYTRVSCTSAVGIASLHMHRRCRAWPLLQGVRIRGWQPDVYSWTRVVMCTGALEQWIQRGGQIRLQLESLLVYFVSVVQRQASASSKCW